MSFVSRVVVAGLVCASLGIVQAVPTAARAQAAASSKGDEPSGDTKARLAHATKCVVTFGFTSGCDKDAPAEKAAPKAAPTAADRAAVTKAAIDSTRGQFFRASKCVVSFGFSGGCDKDGPAGSAPNGSPSASSARADAPPAAPDNSTRAQFAHASKCVATFGFGSGCDKK